MIEVRWRQRSFAEGFLREAVDEFWDDWMQAVDRVLEDDELVATTLRPGFEGREVALRDPRLVRQRPLGQPSLAL